MSRKAIVRNFVVCGKPIFSPHDDGLVIGWKGSFVKISEIKTIHEEETSTPENKRCIFYTYKDEWYAVSQMDYHDLVDAINEYLSTNINEIV